MSLADIVKRLFGAPAPDETATHWHKASDFGYPYSMVAPAQVPEALRAEDEIGAREGFTPSSSRRFGTAGGSRRRSKPSALCDCSGANAMHRREGSFSRESLPAFTKTSSSIPNVILPCSTLCSR